MMGFILKDHTKGTKTAKKHATLNRESSLGFKSESVSREEVLMNLIFLKFVLLNLKVSIIDKNKSNVRDIDPIRELHSMSLNNFTKNKSLN